MDTKTLCLGALRSGPCSGYEIRKLFEEGPFGYFQDISFGSIYPALRRLSDDGLVTVTDQEQDGRPDKKVYQMTPNGHEALGRMVAMTPGADKIRSDLLFALFFADLIPEDRLVELIDARIAMHESMVAELGACGNGKKGCDDQPASAPCNLASTESAPARPGPNFVRGLGLTIHQACLDYYREHRNWLIEANRSNAATPQSVRTESERPISKLPLIDDTISESAT